PPPIPSLRHPPRHTSSRPPAVSPTPGRFASGRRADRAPPTVADRKSRGTKSRTDHTPFFSAPAQGYDSYPRITKHPTYLVHGNKTGKAIRVAQLAPEFSHALIE